MSDKPVFEDGLWASARWARDQNYPETAEKIWSALADGQPFKAICRENGWPYSYVVRWKNESPERQQRYNAALSDWADSLAQEAIGIADTPERGVSTKTKADGTAEVTEEDMLGHRKLKVDTRLRLAAKLDRERYGDSVALTGKGGGPLQWQEIPDDLELARRLAYIFTTADNAIKTAADSSREEVAVPAVPITQEDKG